MKYLVILFLFITASINSQSLTGKIINKSSNLPLPSANIILKNKMIGSTSDKHGIFVLKTNFSSNDTLRISYLGFETLEISVKDLSFEKLNNIYLESKIITSQTILVKGSIAESGITPISFSKIKREQIENNYTNQDVPELLSYSPSSIFYSENGNGLGYNYLSIRGFDQRRISVSINGVPQNDPEDHNVYWIDFPDLLGSTELIQIQRGAGTGISGFAAIGGSINLITSSFSDKPHKEFSIQLGSFNTRKYSLSYSTGLIGGQYSIYAKLSQIQSDGYRNMSWVDLKSYHLSAVKYDNNITTQINLYGGPIEDGLAYTGLPKFAIKDRSERKKNYSYWETDDNGYTYTLDRRTKEIENFFQPHFEILNEFQLSNTLTINSALFLVIGNGFFDYDASWADTNYFRLKKEFGFNLNENPINAIIRAKVENTQWGWIPRFSIKHKNGELILGGELRFHNSNHWGKINYAENLPDNYPYDYMYYYYEGGKDIYSLYLHENYQLNKQINILAETQLTYHKYKIDNEKYIRNNFTIDNLFFNPRLGINYRYDPDISLYFSYSYLTKEPRLKNYYDAAESSGGAIPQFEYNSSQQFDFTKPLVKPEAMQNYETGISVIKKNYSALLNLYYMLFNDEIVKQGQLDRFGQPITGNMDKTVHYGIEASLNYQLLNNIELILNGSYSKNYIKNGKTFVYNSSGNNQDHSQYELLNLEDNPISGFPELIFNGIVNFKTENLFVQFTGKYVGEFYTDNYGENLSSYLEKYPSITDYRDNKVESYFVANIFASYKFFLNSFISDITTFIEIKNLFDNLYAAYGIGKEYFPAAERSFLAGVKVGL